MCDIILRITLDHKNTLGGVRSFSRLQYHLALFSAACIWGARQPPVHRVAIPLRCDTFRAVHSGGSVGRLVVLGVPPDRFDHPAQFLGAADRARHTLGLARHEAVDFGEVIQPIDALAGLTAKFADDPTKRAQWRGFIRKSRLNDPQELREAVYALAGFLRPITAALSSSGSFRGSWIAPGP
jgi:hypothetical protein